MTEYVPNRVPCSRKPEPTPPPQPEPTSGMCDMRGVLYFKLDQESVEAAGGTWFGGKPAKFYGDETKNCGLLGNEIDKNFYFLRAMDIETAYTITENGRKYLVLKRFGCDWAIKVDITDENTYNHKFWVEDGYIYVQFPDGTVDAFRDDHGDGKPVKFLIEGESVHVVTDVTIDGDGTLAHPLSVDPTYRTGEYAPADFFADITCKGETINQFENIGRGHAIITKENAGRFGALYTFGEVKKLNAVLKEKYGEKGWRVPSKEDWAKLLNWAESKPSACENCGELPENFDHNTDKSGNFGCNAGARLKATTLWENYKKNTDDFGFTIYPVGVCPEDYNTAEPTQFGFTGLYKVSTFWTSSERDGEGYVRTFSYGHDDVAQYTESPVKRFSVRLVRDVDGDFDIPETAEILGNHVPVGLMTDGTQQWTLFNISITNYEGCDENGITFPEEWADIETEIPVYKFYELVDCEYVERDEYDLPSNADPVFVEEVPTEVFTDSDPYIYTEDTLHLDMLTETKFYYNVWDGNRWHKKMMREGETVVILYPDYETSCMSGETYVTSANTMHEWMIVFNEDSGLDELVDTLSDIEKEIGRIVSELSERIDDLEKLVTENEEVTAAALNDLNDRLSIVEVDLADLKEKADDSDQRITDLEDRVAALEAAVAELNEEVDELNDKVDELQDKLDQEISARTAVDEVLQAQIDELASKSLEAEDKSIVLTQNGNKTLIRVGIESDDEHIKLGEEGLYFDGNFGGYPEGGEDE